MANRFQHMAHSIPETTKTYGRNGNFTNCMYKGTPNRRHTYHNAPFRSSNTACDQQGFHQRGSARSSNWFYSTSPHEYSNNVFHNSNITVSSPDTSPHARGKNYEGNLLSSIMTEQTIKQAALSSIQTFNGKESKFDTWTKSIENAVQILVSKHNKHSYLQIVWFSTLNSQQIKSTITKPNMEGTQKVNVHAILNYSIW